MSSAFTVPKPVTSSHRARVRAPFGVNSFPSLATERKRPSNEPSRFENDGSGRFTAVWSAKQKFKPGDADAPRQNLLPRNPREPRRGFRAFLFGDLRLE